MMKKLLVLLLVFALAFTMVACGKKDDEDEKTGGKTAAEKYVASVLDEILAANTINLAANIDITTEADGEEITVKGTASLTVAKDEDAEYGYNATASFEGTMTEDGEEETAEGSITLYDGVVYMSANGYEQEMPLDDVLAEIADEDGMVAITDMLSMFYGENGLELPAGVGDALVSGFASVLGLAKKDGGYKFEHDFAADVTEFVEFVGTFEDITIGEAIDTVLAMVDEELSVDAILDKIEDMKDMTVEELYEKIDKAIKDETGMTIQELYETIIEDETVKELLKVNMGTEGYNQLKNLDILDALDEAEVLDLTIDDLVSMAMPGAGINTLIGMVEDYLEMNVAELIYEAMGDDDADCFFDTIASIDANKLYYKLLFKENGGKFSGIEFKAEYDYSMTYYDNWENYDYETGNYFTEYDETDVVIKGSMTVKVDLSSDKTTIEEP